MRIEKKTGNGHTKQPKLPVFFSLNYQLFLATLPWKMDADNGFEIDCF